MGKMKAALAGAVAAWIAGCCVAPSPAAPAPIVASPVVASPVPGSVAPGAEAMPDLDLVLMTQLACASGSSAEACAVTSALAGAGAFDGCPATGQSTWLGVVYALGDPTPERPVPFFLQVRPLATPGACEASARVLVGETADEQADLDRALAALRAGQPPPSDSGAIAYARSAIPEQGFFPLSPTTGVSTVMRTGASLFLRSAPGRVLLVERGEPLVDYPAAHVLASFVVGELWPLP